MIRYFAESGLTAVTLGSKIPNKQSQNQKNPAVSIELTAAKTVNYCSLLLWSKSG